jgi:hypothetical protein
MSPLFFSLDLTRIDRQVRRPGPLLPTVSPPKRSDSVRTSLHVRRKADARRLLSRKSRNARPRRVFHSRCPGPRYTICSPISIPLSRNRIRRIRIGAPLCRCGRRGFPLNLVIVIARRQPSSHPSTVPAVTSNPSIRCIGRTRHDLQSFPPRLVPSYRLVVVANPA